MKLVMKRAWRSWPEGAVIERDDGVANVLIRRGIAEAVDGQEPVAELEVAASRTQAGDRPIRRKRS